MRCAPTARGFRSERRDARFPAECWRSETIGQLPAAWPRSLGNAGALGALAVITSAKTGREIRRAVREEVRRDLADTGGLIEAEAEYRIASGGR